ncbi:MAG: permease [bacterium]|nr:permease [bacterium]
MYLSIPKGMIYQQINQTDFFIDPQNIVPPINFQLMLKLALQHNKHREQVIKLDDFTIYRKRPPYDDNLYLSYIPYLNGKEATKEAVKLVKGNSFYKQVETRGYGEFWFRSVYLSQEKLEAIQVLREEQRENRRHSGDSPCST